MLTNDTRGKLLHRTPSIPNLLHLKTAVCSGDGCNSVEPATGLPRSEHPAPNLEFNRVEVVAMNSPHDEGFTQHCDMGMKRADGIF